MELFERRVQCKGLTFIDGHESTDIIFESLQLLILALLNDSIYKSPFQLLLVYLALITMDIVQVNMIELLIEKLKISFEKSLEFRLKSLTLINSLFLY